MPPVIHAFVLGEFYTNCFVVRDEGHDPCWIVDCGQRPEKMLDFIDAEGLEPRAILLTHAHCDHIWGIDRALARFGGLPIHLHEAERAWCGDPLLNMSGLFGMPVSVSGPTDMLKDGQELALVDSTWRVIHTPGHSPGGVCFVHDASGQAIVGDTLFAGSIGRIDFPTSDPARMRESLFEKILRLPDHVTIYPGHGESTTIGRERETNPFLRREW